MKLDKPEPAKCVKVSFELFKFDGTFIGRKIEPINVWDTNLGTVRTIVLHAFRQHCAGKLEEKDRGGE